MRRKPNEADADYYPRYRAYMKDWRARNKERELAKQNAYFQKNKEHIYNVRRAYTARHREKLNAYHREYRKLNATARRAYMRDWGKRKYKTDENFRLRMILSCRISTALRRKGLRKCYKTEELLGCSLDYFKGYLEGKFKPGMSWANKGKWHIDHIIPVIEFDLRVPAQQKQAFHYSNLQPLWAKENWSKGARRIAQLSGEP